jgi:uncharacterized protein YoxC
MDLSQIVLLVVIIIVAVILIVVGIELIGVLRRAKETLYKADLILDDLTFLTRSLTRGSSTIGHMMQGLESGVQLVGLVTKLIAPKPTKKGD